MGEKGEISHDWSNWKTKNNNKKKVALFGRTIHSIRGLIEEWIKN
jgi:hypothetical protein